MFDTPHTGFDAVLDSLRDIDMGHDLLLDGPGFVDRGGYFLNGELGRVEGVGGRRGSSAGHDLELVSASAELLPGRLAHLGDAVANGRPRRQPMARPGFGAVVPLTHVAVAAGLGDVGLAGEYARPLDRSGLHGQFKAVIAAACVPDGRKTRHQRLPEDAGHRKRVDRSWMTVLKVGAERIVHGADVGVGIDQAGHDGMIPGVDDPCVPWDRYLAGRAHGGYPVVGNHDGSRAIGLGTSGIEYGGILQH